MNTRPAVRTHQYSCLSVLRRAPLLIALALSAIPCHAADQAIEGARGIVAAIDPKSGRYEVRTRELTWTFSGKLGGSASNLGINNARFPSLPSRDHRFRWRPTPPSL